MRGVRAQTLLASFLILLLFPNARAATDFPTFWEKLKSAVVASDKVTVAEMTELPLSMYGSKIKDRAEFLRRYGEIFKGEAIAAQCFTRVKPKQESARSYDVYCPFKATPDDWENAPIRFIFERTKSGWKFTGLDNINE